MSILQEIVSYKKKVLEKQKKKVPQEKLLKLLKKSLSAPRFQKTIAGKGIHLIAELKKASPSAGIIAKNFDISSIAAAYQKGKASCLSILTEDKFFKGELSSLDKVRKTVRLPLLRKDFIIDEYQIYESKVHKADAILLIASLLGKETLKRFLKIASKVKLDTVVEIHNLRELKKALDAGAKIIGINTRNLADFSVDFKILPKLLKKIPAGRLVIIESGVKSLKDLALIKKYKVNAVLVGESLMRAKNTAAQTRAFVDFLKKEF